MGLAVKEISKIDDFRNAVSVLRDLTAHDLTRVNQAILAKMHSSVKMIPEVAGHLINAGGKRLRPVMTLASAGALSYSGDKHICLAAAVEMIHGATLLHDDVVDDSLLRRGLETANNIFGNKESILVGDFLFSRAFELMVDSDSLKVLRILSNASCVISEGEVLQLAAQQNIDTDFAMYLEVIKAKTAALFAAAAQAGAVIAGADEQIEQAFYQYGLNFGIAFQLIDDALDYSGTEQALGKAIGDDFREGKMTLPVVFAIAGAKTPEEKDFWYRAIAKMEQQDGDLETALTLMQRDQVIEKTCNCAKGFADQAIAALKIIPENEYTIALCDMAAKSVQRGF